MFTASDLYRPLCDIELDVEFFELTDEIFGNNTTRFAASLKVIISTATVICGRYLQLSWEINNRSDDREVDFKRSKVSNSLICGESMPFVILSGETYATAWIRRFEGRPPLGILSIISEASCRTFGRFDASTGSSEWCLLAVVLSQP